MMKNYIILIIYVITTPNVINKNLSVNIHFSTLSEVEEMFVKYFFCEVSFIVYCFFETLDILFESQKYIKKKYSFYKSFI